MKLLPEIKKNRKPEYEINPLILNRHSLRAMSGEPLSEEELLPLFEAAKWAPSSFNNQPWRFIYAERNSNHWNAFFNLLNEGNKSWCKNAGVLVVMISRKTMEFKEKPNPTHSFDAGAAWENLALEATSRGLIAHGMVGFDYKKARKELKIPGNFQVEAMCAIGKKGKIKELPENLREMETPNGRKQLKEIIMEGKFKENK